MTEETNQTQQIFCPNGGHPACHIRVRALTVNADGRVVLQAQVDVLIDAEAEVAGRGEVAVLELELLHGQTLLQDLLGLLTADGDVAGDLLVTADGEGAHGQTGLAENGLLVGELGKHLGGTGEPITALTNGAVDHQLGDLRDGGRMVSK